MTIGMGRNAISDSQFILTIAQWINGESQLKGVKCLPPYPSNAGFIQPPTFDSLFSNR